ncbi:MAG: site-specific integrase [Holophagales bacterium]|nr:site-specific integrase [Holophagales bacterium]
MNTAELDFPRLLQEFFLRRLVAERGASQQTIASYRYAFQLLLRFAEQRCRRPPSKLTLSDLDAPLILAFLDHLETGRGNSTRSRNARLTAIRSFMLYASTREPTSLPIVQRVLAIPAKRFDRPILGFLDRDEMQAVLDAPDRSTWSGHRDAVLFATFYNTGARVSEITALRVEDVLLERRTSLLLHGKGRKERVIPLWESTAVQLRTWLDGIDRSAEAPVFPNRAGRALSRFGVRQRLQRAVAEAAKHCPSLAGRSVSPHTLRHTTAMHLLQSGVDLTVIALWLGHEDPSTTHQYLEADLALKEAALRRVEEPKPALPRFRANDRLLAFLETL